MAKLTSDQLGAAGERYFPNLCDERLHVNQVGEDRTGWDFYLEWTGHSVDDQPFDLAPQALTCLVQVKAMGPKSEWITANLATIGRLAKEPKPTFLYVLTYDEETNPVAGRIIPVRGTFMAKILREQRRAYKDKKKRNSDFRFKASDWGETVELKRQTLRTALEAHIGTDIATYMAAKKHEYDTLGYEEGRLILRGKFQVADRAEIREAYLTGNNVTIDVLSAVDRRFGLEVTAPGISIGPTTGRFVGQRPLKGTVRIWTAPLEPPTSFEGKWQIIPEGIAKPGFGEGVFQTTLFSLRGETELNRGPKDRTINLTFQVSGEKVIAAKLKPNLWADYYCLMLNSLGHSLRLRMEVVGKPSVSGGLTLNHPADSEAFYRKMVRLTQVLNRACNIAGAPNVVLGVNDLHDQREAMLQLGAFMDRTVTGQASFGSELSDPFQGGETVSVLYMFTIPLGEFALMYCVRIDFVSTRTDTEVSWTSTDMEFLGLSKVMAPVGHVVSPDAVAYLDEMRMVTGIDSYYFENLPAAS